MEYKVIGLNNAESIIDIWNNNIGALFPMDNALFIQNYKNDRQNKKILIAYDGNNIAGFIIYKQWSSPSGIIKPNPERGYINSFIVDMKYRNSGIGTKLLNLAESDLKKSGVKTISVGSDTYHFFPGIPSGCITFEKFLLRNGYEIKESYYDLICDISKVELENLPDIKLNNNDKYEVEIFNTNEKDNLFDFFRKCFSGRWYEEMMEFFEAGMEDRDIVVLKDKDKNQIIGFSHIYDNRCKFIGPPVYWRNLLGRDYGGLGPIGIDEDYRKQGLGLLILYKSLEILKSRRVKNMVIDWTDNDILDFYGLFNFMTWKEYKKAIKKI